MISLSSSKLAFPGLGIDEFTLDKVAFTIFGRDVAWYGLIITTGIILAFLYVYLRTKKDGLLFDDLIDIAFFTVIPAIICARLYYVIFYELEHPGSYPDVHSVIAVWNGGLAIYGANIRGAISSYLVLKKKKVRIAKFFDALAPAVMIGQIIGRWGNFVNSEAYGSETTLPWRMGVMEYGQMIYVHPTFIYESLWNLVGFILINLFAKKKKYDGQLFFAYISWYGFGRMLIEGLRTDSLMIGSSGIRVSQLIGFCCFIVGLFFFIYFAVKLRNKPIAQCIYTESSPYYKAPDTEAGSSEKSEEAEANTDGKTDGDIGTEDDKNV